MSVAFFHKSERGEKWVGNNGCIVVCTLKDLYIKNFSDITQWRIGGGNNKKQSCLSLLLLLLLVAVEKRE
jgi:hypothetical protein